MKIVGLKEENREYFSALDPFNIMGRECKNGAVCLGAVMREKNVEMPAGLLVFTLNENELLINWIYVEHRYRGLEIGDELLETVFDLARESGKNYVCACLPDEYGIDLVCKGGEEFLRFNGFYRDENASGRCKKLFRSEVYESNEAEKELPYGIIDKLLYVNDEDEEEFLSVINGDNRSKRKAEKGDMVVTMAVIADVCAAWNGKKDRAVTALGDLTLQDFEQAVRRCLEKHGYDAYEGDPLKLGPGWYDLQISSCVITDGEVSGLFLIHKDEDGSLWPEYLFDCAQEPEPNLVKMMKKSAALAINNYPSETKVVIRMKTAKTRKLAEMMLTGKA